MHNRATRTFLIAAALLLSVALRPAAAAGFVKIFDGKTLNGWTLVNRSGPGYQVENGILVCPPEEHGNLYTDKEYSDFVFRFDFKLSPGGNSGVGLRAPLQGDAAYAGMECQILDDYAPEYANLEPGQYHGSLYKIVPAKRGALKKAGEWNSEEISALGRHIVVKLNGKTIVDADLNSVHNPEILRQHPGMLRSRGHIGFLGHTSRLEFRNIYLKDLSRAEKDNAPPAGFTALFNGRNLNGWKGLVADPPTRAKMSADELDAATKKATVEALKHWQVVNGAITYDGKNNSLCTVKDYGDFEMLVDWKIQPGGDSGIYLRGSPQVQIWDNPLGSGGLYNNQKNPSNPLAVVDNKPGEWNRFRILMVGDRVHVFLNNVLVVNDTVMENYWERDKPIYPTGQIELQHHNSPLEFKNIYIREIPRE